jgi:N-acetyl-gamma-glutamyl-phosphate reductase common form
VGQGVAAALGVPEARAALSAPDLVFSDVGPEQLAAGAHPPVDAWVLALPNGLCAAHAAAIEAGAAARGQRAPPLMLDLSADMRFCASGGRGPGGWVYGLPERPGARAALASARRIANPGCYATGAQLALLPLLSGSGGGLHWDAAAKPHVFGVSGYSGAGTTPSDKNDPERLRDNILAYSLVNHIHEREVGWHCGLGSRGGAGASPPGAGGVAFMPHVAPFFQGIHLTVTGHLAPGGSAPSADAIAARFAAFYEGEKLVAVLGKDTPDVARHGTGKHGVTLGGFTYDPATRRVALVSCIDNLLKGAATQALQNINLAMGEWPHAQPTPPTRRPNHRPPAPFEFQQACPSMTGSL